MKGDPAERAVRSAPEPRGLLLVLDLNHRREGAVFLPPGSWPGSHLLELCPCADALSCVRLCGRRGAQAPFQPESVERSLKLGITQQRLCNLQRDLYLSVMMRQVRRLPVIFPAHARRPLSRCAWCGSWGTGWPVRLRSRGLCLWPCGSGLTPWPSLFPVPTKSCILKRGAILNFWDSCEREKRGT